MLRGQLTGPWFCVKARLVQILARMNSKTSPLGLANLGPLAQLRADRFPERLVRLLAGLWLYGVSNTLLMKSALGGSPWVVFHQGAAQHLPLSLGGVMVLVAVAVLLLGIPLRQMPGWARSPTRCCWGLSPGFNLRMFDAPESLPFRCVCLAGGMLVCALVTALYVGAQLGPGPRDGLMTGFARRTGWSIQRVRTGIEIVVLAMA
ncbi:hypothetical protein LYSHEL_21620 [Lysobacter helvus]|uniref:Uncharacterized protein n=3 Tax=Lysobacterales TaxID=135614 RepID=A0ABN6FTT6_9GAMM|nr:hypothetical protein LYSCAS_21630 [Lysobacter caseinilyticus]BCT96291.1 hypothetical protein LYSHEL_21620 [Lysobacter helvus]